MTDVFGMFPMHYDTNNNATTCNSNTSTEFNSANNLLNLNMDNCDNLFQENNFHENNQFSLIDNSNYSNTVFNANCVEINKESHFKVQTEEYSPLNEKKLETIHSGHFMVSEIDDTENELPNPELEKINLDKNETKEKNIDLPLVKANFSLNISSINSSRNYETTYPKIGLKKDCDKLLIKEDLTKLFKRMQLGYNSKVTSPKWKTFKGFNLRLRDKIRLNNLIWRAWHIKYVLYRSPKFNPFPSRIENLDHNEVFVGHRSESIMLFKNLWRSNDSYVLAEYKKWRTFYIEKLKNQKCLENNLDLWDEEYIECMDYNPIFPDREIYKSQIEAEYLQPGLRFNEQMNFFEYSSAFNCFKNSPLPTVLEENIEEVPKIANIDPQLDLYSNECRINENTINHNNQITNYDHQIQPTTQSLHQITNLQHTQTSSNYNFINIQPQSQNLPAKQPQLNNTIQYQQNFNLQNTTCLQLPNQTSSIGQNTNSSLSSIQKQPHQNVTNSINQQLIHSLPMNQNLNANFNPNLINTNNTNNSDSSFIFPKQPEKQRIRSRSVSSLPYNQQQQLHQQHLENSSSLLDILTPVANNSMKNVSSSNNINSKAITMNKVHSSNPIQSNEQINSSICLAESSNTFHVRRNAMNSMMNAQLFKQHGILQTSASSTTSFFNSVLNENTNLNNFNQQTNSSVTNDSLFLDYNTNNAMISTSSSSYFNPPLQTNSNDNITSTPPQQVQNQQQQINQIYFNKYSLSNDQSNNNQNVISQLLNTDNLKLNNLKSTNSTNLTQNLPYKRNSTGTYSNFSNTPVQDQYTSSSMSRIDLNCNASNSIKSTNRNNELNLIPNQLGNNQHLRKTNSQPIINSQPILIQNSFQTSNNSRTCFNNQLNPMINQVQCLNNENQLSTNQSSNPINQNRNSTELNQISLSSSIHSNNNNSNLQSVSGSPNSFENTSKTLNKSHQIRNAKKERKLSVIRLSRNNSSNNVSHNNLICGNNAKPINNSLSPTNSKASRQTTSSHLISNKNSVNTSTNNFMETSNFNRQTNSLASLPNNNNYSNINTQQTSNLIQPNSLNNQNLILNDYQNSDNQFQLLNSQSQISQQGTYNSKLNNNLNKTKSNQAVTFSNANSNMQVQNSTNSCSSNSGSPLGSLVVVKTEQERIQYKEHRRVSHINAEQKRRCNIKNGFDTLRTILSSINVNCNTKISKAAMLQKGAEHIRLLRIENEQQKKEMDTLRSQIDKLNQTIGYKNIFQDQLPATGAPVFGMRPGQIKEKFDEYVKEKTLQNWKFWMFSIIIEPLLDSYNNTVPTTNIDELTSSVLRWLDQSCNLINLRRDVLNSLRIISTSTNVLVNPKSLSEESIAAVKKKSLEKQDNKNV